VTANGPAAAPGAQALGCPPVPDAIPTHEAVQPSYLDSRWHRGLLDELCGFERETATAGERRAAQWLAAQLSEQGGQARLETERLHSTFWWPLGLATGAGALAGLAALRGHRVLGAALAAGAAAAAADDMPPNRRRLRSLLPKREVTQVVASFGPEDAERTVVVLAHHDAPHSGLIFNPAIPDGIDRVAPRVLGSVDTSPPFMWAVVGGPLASAAGALTGSRALARAGAALSAIVASLIADIGRRPVVAGANDNGTAVVGLIALARALAERPTESVRMLLVSTSEEALCEGMTAFARRHFPELPKEGTFFLCLEILGSPHLLVLRGEGMLKMREYPSRSLELLDGLAEELGIWLYPNLRLRNATDAVIPLAEGYECAALCSCTHHKQPANYHWPTDTPDNVNYETLADAIRLSEAVVRRLDDRWLD
jgi:peptidase M28-like protein